MRLPAFPLLVLLALTGCTQVHFPFLAGHDPYAPAGTGETMRRVNGQPPAVPRLATAAGNVWPKPIKAVPTLETLEQQQLTLPNQPVAPPVPGSNATPVARLPGIPAVPRVAPTPPFTTTGGAGIPTGGTSGYRTIHLHDGTSAIVVPNGNGTSTIIRADGSVETVPTPK